MRDAPLWLEELAGDRSSRAAAASAPDELPAGTRHDGSARSVEGVQSLPRPCEFRFERLTEPQSGASYCMEDFQAEIEALLGSGELAPAQSALLEQLLEYADSLLA